MDCANLNSWSGELRHSAGWATFRVLLWYLSRPEIQAREERADCCGANCTELYKSRSHRGSNDVNCRRQVPTDDLYTVRRTDPPGVSPEASRMFRSPKFCAGAFRKTERKTTISPVLGRCKRREHDFVRIWRRKRFGTPIALTIVVRALRRLAEQSGERPAVMRDLDDRGTARRTAPSGAFRRPVTGL